MAQPTRKTRKTKSPDSQPGTSGNSVQSGLNQANDAPAPNNLAGGPTASDGPGSGQEAPTIDTPPVVGPLLRSGNDPAPIAVQTDGRPLTTDIPGFEDLPADVRERLQKARRDPSRPEPVRVIRQSQVVRVGAPGADDIFRTHADPRVGWFDVQTVAIKKGFGQAVNKKVILVGENALKNPAVAQRARPGVAILTLTTENIVGVWVIQRPDIVAAEASYPYDVVKWQCAEAARVDWVTFAWNKDLGIHQWSTINLDGQPNATPIWPAEHPLILIERAISAVFIDEPDFPEFKHLMIKKSSV
jgi:hypothetical protein